MAAAIANQFFQIPPFPGARATTLQGRGSLDDGDNRSIDGVIELIRHSKVGGTYWAAQPELSRDDPIVIRVRDSARRAEAIASYSGSRPLVCWVEPGWSRSTQSGRECIRIAGPVDPWHALARASQLITDCDDDVALIALLSNVELRLVGDASRNEGFGLRERFANRVPATWTNPFTGEEMDCEAAARLCCFWRELVDSNRPIGAAVGFAFWKRKTVAPLLWGGSGDVPFASSGSAAAAGAAIAIWKSRTGEETLARLERSGAPLVEVEDGFIRSVGLGSDCVPPLSIIVDCVGIYFDPSRPSQLELLLQEGRFSSELLDRARSLREAIVEGGITKYAVGDGGPPLWAESGRPNLLVVGQVEDDRAILEGAGSKKNIELLERVRDANPRARIIYKPHPDVEAGHRTGAIPDELCLNYADEIVRGAAISSLIAVSDEIHTISSLAGFEALLRGKVVTTYGVPFYAGWGLTRDLGPVPKRRSARRTLDELVAAALILYPRYLDPITGLPCPAEVEISRLTQAHPRESGVVKFRKLQGRLNRAVGRVRS
jgi:capsular polysaccharide export protein